MEVGGETNTTEFDHRHIDIDANFMPEASTPFAIKKAPQLRGFSASVVVRQSGVSRCCVGDYRLAIAPNTDTCF